MNIALILCNELFHSESVFIYTGCEIRRSTLVKIFILLQQPLLPNGCMRGCCRLKDALSLSQLQCTSSTALLLVWWVVVDAAGGGNWELISG